MFKLAQYTFWYPNKAITDIRKSFFQFVGPFMGIRIARPAWPIQATAKRNFSSFPTWDISTKHIGQSFCPAKKLMNRCTLAKQIAY